MKNDLCQLEEEEKDEGKNVFNDKKSTFRVNSSSRVNDQYLGY
jgi:hypothetical protein